MFDLTQLENGNLQITLDAIGETEIEELKEEILEKMQKKTDLAILIEGTESYFTNGSFHPFCAGDGNPFVGLTEAPCVAECLNFDDDGKAEIEGEFWYYGDYMITSFLEKILEDGRVEFTLYWE